MTRYTVPRYGRWVAKKEKVKKTPKRYKAYGVVGVAIIARGIIKLVTGI